MKKRYRSVPILLALLFVPVSYGHSLGIGFIVGEPTGLSIKKWLDDKHALDVAVGWDTSGNSSVHLQGDYLYHQHELLQGLARDLDLSGQLSTYVGVGARIKLKEKSNGNDDTLVGVRVPLGLSYRFRDAPVDLFLEGVPTMDLAPDTDFSLNAAAGARYYF